MKVRLLSLVMKKRNLPLFFLLSHQLDPSCSSPHRTSHHEDMTVISPRFPFNYFKTHTKSKYFVIPLLCMHNYIAWRFIVMIFCSKGNNVMSINVSLESKNKSSFPYFNVQRDFLSHMLMSVARSTRFTCGSYS